MGPFLLFVCAVFFLNVGACPVVGLYEVLATPTCGRGLVTNQSQKDTRLAAGQHTACIISRHGAILVEPQKAVEPGDAGAGEPRGS